MPWHRTLRVFSSPPPSFPSPPKGRSNKKRLAKKIRFQKHPTQDSCRLAPPPFFSSPFCPSWPRVGDCFFFSTGEAVIRGRGGRESHIRAVRPGRFFLPFLFFFPPLFPPPFSSLLRAGANGNTNKESRATNIGFFPFPFSLPCLSFSPTGGWQGNNGKNKNDLHLAAGHACFFFFFSKEISLTASVLHGKDRCVMVRCSCQKKNPVWRRFPPFPFLFFSSSLL